jgi:hypothetical protein
VDWFFEFLQKINIVLTLRTKPLSPKHLIMSQLSTFLPRLLFVLALYLLCFSSACTFDQLDPAEPGDCTNIEATYDTNIQPIITTYCSYSGCHVQGFPSGDFSTYSAMLARLESGSVETRTIGLMDMPPQNASGPKDLTPEDLELLTCWLSNGFPEN